jgi:uncharacterized protein (TIGR02001 family)
MHKVKVNVLILAGLAGLPAIATTAYGEEAPASPHTFTSNVNLVSDYRFRGLEQTWGQPALQGGFDYSHASGFYAGVWGSNVSGNSYPGGSLELDLYAGYNGKLGGDFGWTAGAYGYYYPGSDYDKAAACATSTCASQTPDTVELNAGVSWKWISYKLSYAATDYFGANTKTGYADATQGTLYQDLSVNYPILSDLTLNLHIGQTNYAADLASGVNPDYTDYKIGVTKTFTGGWNAAIAYVGANNDTAYTNVQALSTTAPDTRDENKATVVVQVGRTF